MNATKTFWTVEGITGSYLLSSNPARTPHLPESTGKVYSRHQTKAAAEKSLAKLQRISPLVQRAVFERGGES